MSELTQKFREINLMKTQVESNSAAFNSDADAHIDIDFSLTSLQKTNLQENSEEMKNDVVYTDINDCNFIFS